MDPTAVDQPFVSVIVPVRDGESTIADCIDAILATDYPADRREILVVDNGSTDGTAARDPVPPGPLPARAQARRLQRPQPRHRGEHAATSSPSSTPTAWSSPSGSPSWSAPSRTPRSAASAATSGTSPPTTAAERQAARLLGNWQRFAFTSNPAYAITANAAYRRDVLDRIGPFDPHMTRAQDVELGLRFQERSGRRLAYAEHATARHRHRSTQRGFFRQQLGWAYGAGLVGAKFEAMGGHPVSAAPHPRHHPHPLRGLGIVLCARLRGRGRARVDRGRLVRPAAPGRLVGRRPRRPAQGRPHLASHSSGGPRSDLSSGVSIVSPGRRKTISGTRQFGEVRSRNRTASAMSSGRIIASAATCPLTNSVIGVSTNAGAKRRHLDPLARDLLLGRLREADHRRLGRRVHRQPRLPGLAGDRGRVDDQRLAVLGAGLAAASAGTRASSGSPPAG